MIIIVSIIINSSSSSLVEISSHMRQPSPIRLNLFAYWFTCVCLQLVCPTNSRGYLPTLFQRCKQAEYTNEHEQKQAHLLQEPILTFISLVNKGYTQVRPCVCSALVFCSQNIACYKPYIQPITREITWKITTKLSPKTRTMFCQFFLLITAEKLP